MLKTYKYRIYPTKAQQKTIDDWLESCKTLYNQALFMRKNAYEENEKTLSFFDQGKMLTQLRKESSHWSSLPQVMLEDVLNRVHKAYQNFFRRVRQLKKSGEKPGFPRFKKGRYRSITFRRPPKKLIQQIGGRLARLNTRAGLIKIRYHRPLPDGNIRTLTIQRQASGWYAMVSIKIDDVQKCESQNAVGVDVGLNSFLATSDGNFVENPRYFRISELNLKRLQRRLSKRKKGSGRWRKIKDRIGRLHEHIANQRRDFHHKIAHRLYQKYDTVVVEDLQIRNMVKNHHLAKSISDAAWGNFRLTLDSKAESAGCHLIKVSPHGTSQKCSNCDEIVKKSLVVRVHKCACGLVIDRDVNAARNILRVASTLREGVLVTNSPETPDSSGRKREIDSHRIAVGQQLTLF